MTFSPARSPVHFTHIVHHDGLLVGATLAASVLLAGYSTYGNATCKIAGAITPYHIDIMQDSFVSREQAVQLKKDMTRDQVRLTLDTPLLTDMSHANHRGCTFSFKRGNTLVIQGCQLTAWLDDDRLAKRVGADELPSEPGLISEIDGIRRPGKDTVQAVAATGTAPVAHAPSIPSVEVTGRV